MVNQKFGLGVAAQVYKILHENYFSAMNYYFVEFSDKVKDLMNDHQRCKFVGEGMTDVVMTFVYSLSSGIYFIPQLTYNLWHHGCCLALHHNGTNGRFQGTVAGMSGREYAGLNGKLAGVNGEVRSTSVETQLHSEAIALGGAEVEKHYNEKVQSVYGHSKRCLA